jgi:hypothetical protein
MISPFMPFPGKVDADLDLLEFDVEYDAEAVIGVVRYIPFAADEDEGRSSSSSKSKCEDLRVACRDERLVLRLEPGLGREGGGGGEEEEETEEGELLRLWMRRCLGFDGSAVGDGERRFREVVVVAVVVVAFPFPLVLTVGRGGIAAFVATGVVFTGTALTTLVIFTLVPAPLFEITGFPLKKDEALEDTVDMVEVLVVTDIILDEPDTRDDEAEDNVEDDRSERGEALP